MIAPMRMQLVPEVESPVTKYHQDRFLQLLPKIQRQTRWAFRRLPRDAREEMVAEAVAGAFALFVRLVRRGKSNLAYATPLARFAIRQVRAGKGIARRSNVHDVLSTQARKQHGITIQRLESLNRRCEWCELLVENRRCTPADIAASRLDMAAWLSMLSARNRRIAMVLGTGEAPHEVARQFRVSRGRISQIRSWLATSWEEFQGGRHS